MRAMPMGFALLLIAAVASAGDEPPRAGDEPLRVGDEAPDFSLKDQAGNAVSLKRYRGKKNVVLAFFPKAFTGG